MKRGDGLRLRRKPGEVVTITPREGGGRPIEVTLLSINGNVAMLSFDGRDYQVTRRELIGTPETREAVGASPASR